MDRPSLRSRACQSWLLYRSALQCSVGNPTGYPRGVVDVHGNVDTHALRGRGVSQYGSGVGPARARPALMPR